MHRQDLSDIAPFPHPFPSFALYAHSIVGLPVPDGIYCIQVPYEGGGITDVGEGRWLEFLPKGNLGPDAHKVVVKYNMDKNAYSFQFEKSKKFITYGNEPSMNNKLVLGDKPRYFTIRPHEYETDQFVIGVAEKKEYNVAMALERIYPPWVAMSNFSPPQPWHIAGIY
ncbi:hypothetical protein RhiJN_24143 [Ceratobasidium sp. AG-Ba]|nr:hypothetical protein RhiJN_24143 [Ceratobasidium sp. AG-Ba]